MSPPSFSPLAHRWIIFSFSLPEVFHFISLLIHGSGIYDEKFSLQYSTLIEATLEINHQSRRPSFILSFFLSFFMGDRGRGGEGRKEGKKAHRLCELETCSEAAAHYDDALCLCTYYMCK